MEDITESDKEHFFNEMCGMKRYHRNILSYALFGISNVAVLTLAVFKITHPAILIASCAISGMSHFLKTSTTADKLKNKVIEQTTKIDEQFKTIRRLSIENSQRSVSTEDTFKSALSVLSSLDEPKLKHRRNSLRITIPETDSDVSDGPKAPTHMNNEINFEVDID